MNLKNRISNLEQKQSDAAAKIQRIKTCGCPNVAVIKPGGWKTPLCSKCLESGNYIVRVISPKKL